VQQRLELSVTDKTSDIQRGLRTLAHLIDAYGDEYWPLFERLESELVRHDRRRNKIAAILQNCRDES